MPDLRADDRQFAPATQRNREPIFKVLQAVLPPEGTVLEVASGTGEHAVYLAPRLAPRWWQPSDRDRALQASVESWRRAEPCDRLLPVLALDAAAPRWPVEEPAWPPAGPDGTPPPAIAAIACINMTHIAPWEATLGLLAGAGRLLPSGGVLYLYGPFVRRDRPTAPSNEAFDRSLRWQNPAWGLRDLDAVAAAAGDRGLALDRVVEMPANNLSVVFRR